jgi:hypothetical protein
MVVVKMMGTKFEEHYGSELDKVAINLKALNHTYVIEHIVNLVKTSLENLSAIVSISYYVLSHILNKVRQNLLVTCCTMQTNPVDHSSNSIVLCRQKDAGQLNILDI